MDDKITAVGEKLSALTKLLSLYACDENGQFQGKIKPVSHKSILPAQVICPNAVVCETNTCNPRSLLQTTRIQDIPRVTLIKGCDIFENVQIFTGRCPKCKTNYLADRERVIRHDNKNI